MKEHAFLLSLTPKGPGSVVYLDDLDISGLLVGVVVRSNVHEGTTVELQPARGKRAELTILLPEAQILIAEEP